MSDELSAIRASIDRDANREFTHYAQKDARALLSIVDNLALLLRRYLANPESIGIRNSAIDYLSKHGLNGSLLRKPITGLDCGVDLRTGKGICVCGRCSTDDASGEPQ